MSLWHKRALIGFGIWTVVAAGFAASVFFGGGPAEFAHGATARNIAAGFVAAGIFSDLVLRFLTRKRSKSASVRIDERDILISRRSSEGGFFVLAVFVFLSCIALHDAYQESGGVPVGWLWVLAYTSWILGYLSLAVSALFFYTRGGGGGNGEG